MRLEQVRLALCCEAALLVCLLLLLLPTHGAVERLVHQPVLVEEVVLHVALVAELGCCRGGGAVSPRSQFCGRWRLVSSAVSSQGLRLPLMVARVSMGEGSCVERGGTPGNVLKTAESGGGRWPH